MIGFYIMMVSVIALASGVGYLMISSLQTSSGLSLAGQNALRLAQTVDALRHVVVTDADGRLFVPMGDSVDAGDPASRTTLPGWISNTAMTPWGTDYGYCPYGPFTWSGATSGTAEIRDADGISHTGDVFSDPVIFGASRDYVSNVARPAAALDFGPVPDVLAFIVSPTNNSQDVPACDSIYWDGRAWLVSGDVPGSVRALTVDTLTDSLSMAPRILNRHVAPGATGSGLTPGEPASFEQALAEWRYLRPARMTIVMEPGTYAADLDNLALGSPGVDPSVKTLSRFLHLAGTGAVLTDTGSGGTLSVSGDVALSGITLAADAALHAGPAARILLDDVTVASTLSVDGGMMTLSDSSVAPSVGAVPLTVSGGRLVLAGATTIDMTGHAGLSAVALNGGDLHLSGAATFSSASGDGSTPLLSESSFGRFSHGPSASLTIDGVISDLSGKANLLYQDDRVSAAEVRTDLITGLDPTETDAITTCTGAPCQVTATCPGDLKAISGTCDLSGAGHALTGTALTAGRDGFTCQSARFDEAAGSSALTARALCAPLE